MSTSIRPWILISLLSYWRSDVTIYEFQSTNFKREEILANFVLCSFHCFFFLFLFFHRHFIARLLQPVLISNFFLFFFFFLFQNFSPPNWELDHSDVNIIVPSTHCYNSISIYCLTTWRQRTAQFMHEAFDHFQILFVQSTRSTRSNGQFFLLSVVRLSIIRSKEKKISRDLLMFWFEKKIKQKKK